MVSSAHVARFTCDCVYAHCSVLFTWMVDLLVHHLFDHVYFIAGRSHCLHVACSPRLMTSSFAEKASSASFDDAVK